MRDPSTPADHIENELRVRTLAGLLDQPSTFVLPDYEGRSLLNVPATLGRLLGVELPGIAAPLGEEYWRPFARVRRIVLVLLDAFGYRHLQQIMAEQPQGLWARLAAQGLLLPMTSVFPSTTNTSLATLLTGRGPAAHGLLGYELWLREYGVLAEMLALKPAYGTEGESLLDWGLEPQRFLPVPSLPELLSGHRVRTIALVAEQHRRSGLTRMLYRPPAQLIGYSSAAEMWSRTADALRDDHAGRSLLFVYYGGIDATAHRHGTAGGYWQREVRSVTDAFEENVMARLTASDREGTLLILIADHGFVDSPEELARDTDSDDALRQRLAIPFGGESRAAYLHTLEGPTAEEQAAVQEVLGPDYAVVSARIALEKGLFGPPPYYSESRARIGHFVAVPKGLCYLDRQGKRHQLRGRHGGLLPEEMLVPWLAVPLDG